MSGDEGHYRNLRQQMASEDYAPGDWRDDHESDYVPDEEEEDDE